MMVAGPRRALMLVALAASGFLLVPARGMAAEGGGKPAFVTLGEFTVNLPAGTEGLTYLVIDVTLEVAPDATTGVSAVLPRLKEAVVRRLMAMSAHGDLQPQHIGTDALKKALLEGIGKVQPNSLRDVLITRLLFG